MAGRMPHDAAKLNNPRSFGIDAYGPLDFTTCLSHPHDMPTKNLKWMPWFNGDNVISTSNHVEAFFKATVDNAIEHEDVFMKLFTNSLKGIGHL